jgi:hypothetical protein
LEIAQAGSSQATKEVEMQSAIADPGLIRAVERVKLACRALNGAAGDVLLAMRDEGSPIDETARELHREAERVCQLAGRLEECVSSLGTFAGASR